MDEKEQVAGERRVQELLISPLLKLGLTKPGGLRKDAFEEMLKELRQKLAYMSEQGLGALNEWCEGHPGGKDGDRFPIALKILKQAHKIEVPELGPSPLILKVFGHHVGQEALDKGYGPELLDYLRGERKWPGSWTLSKIKEKADDPKRRLEDVQLRLARGEQVGAEDQEFMNARRAVLRKCEDIAAQARGKAPAHMEASA